MSKDLLIRVQSPDGTKRIELPASTSMSQLYASIQSAFALNDLQFAVYRERNFTNELAANSKQSLTAANLKHGDLIYLRRLAVATASSSGSAAATASAASTSKDLPTATATATSKDQIVEDDVDVQLAKLDGTIKRNRDPKLCRHNSNGCCVHCSPIEPWDEAYLREQKIKHISFHAYIRKMTSGVDRGKFVALEDLNCRIRTGCTDHPPWPRGICSHCQPSAITLNRQVYRHVDNVMFENTTLVERFLNYWRTTGHQRMGFLYGTYEVNGDVPLGLRARVAAIYEPPQESSRDSIKLLPQDEAAAAEVDELAAVLGLTKVGWIFTDLITDDPAVGTVKTVRGIDTHFLTAQECILAGHLQNQHPNRSKYASNGKFGSKFVTVCVTGDAKKQVHMEGYAVSAQCMALVRDNCLVPTRDAPELGYVRESGDKQFVPDVYYKEKDQYGNEVSRLARPLPVEYLLVDVPASTPLVPLATFTARTDRQMFPVENRYLDGHLQDFNAVSSYWTAAAADEFLDAISDFHLLLYLARMEMLPMKAAMRPLLEAVRRHDAAAALQWKRDEDVWTTLETLIAASSSSAGGSQHYPASGVGGAVAQDWECTECTYINAGVMTGCEMCGTPQIIN